MATAYARFRWWTIEEEHLLDRLYRGEDRTVQEIASMLGRNEIATRCRLTLLYFGREGGTESQRDPKPWCDGIDAQLKDLYEGSEDRDVIFKKLGHKPWWVASRLLEIIPRSQLSLIKARAVGSCLDPTRPARSITEYVLQRMLTSDGRVNARVLRLPVMQAPAFLPNCVPELEDLFPFRVAICCLGFLWEDEFRGLLQIELARRRLASPQAARPVPGAVARLIMGFLA